MGYFDSRGAHSGKSTTDEIFSFNDLLDKMLSNALFAGRSFGWYPACHCRHAANSPVLQAFNASNTFFSLDQGVQPIMRLTDIQEQLPRVVSCHNRIVSYEEIDRTQLYELLSRFEMCSSVNGYIKTASLLDDPPTSGRLIVSAKVADLICVATFKETDDVLFIENSYASWNFLLHPEKWFSGVPYILSEGVITFPEVYQTPRTIDKIRTVEDAVFDTACKALVNDVIESTRSMIGIGKGSGYRVTASGSTLEQNADELVRLIGSENYHILSTAGSVTLTDANLARDLRRLLGSDAVVRARQEAQISVNEIQSLSIDNIVDKVLSQRSSGKSDVLRALYDKILSTTGGVSTDPFATRISHDNVSFPARNGRVHTINGSPLDLLFQVPGMFFFDSLGSVIYTAGGSALAGGIATSVFKTLYRSTYCHGIFNYAGQGKDDPLLKYDLAPMTSGDLDLEGEVLGVPSSLSITTRVIQKRNLKIQVARFDRQNGEVGWKIPRQITGGRFDLEFSFKVDENLMNEMSSRTVGRVEYKVN